MSFSYQSPLTEKELQAQRAEWARRRNTGWVQGAKDAKAAKAAATTKQPAKNSKRK